VPGGARENADGVLIAALAAGRTTAEAALLAGVSESTAFRRKRNRKFRRAVDRARTEVLERAVGQITDGTTEAVAELRTLVKGAASEAVKLGAIRTALEYAVRGRDMLGLSRELDRLRAEVERAMDEHRNRPAGSPPPPRSAPGTNGRGGSPGVGGDASGPDSSVDAGGFMPGPVADGVIDDFIGANLDLGEPPIR
jgi:hypothetical protein